MNTVHPVFIGYFPKRRAIPPGPWIPPQVVQICNVGHCGGFGPADWMAGWRHNQLSVFDSEILAWSVMPEKERDAFEIHGYKLAPVLYLAAGPRPIEIPGVAPDPMPVEYRRIGYDPVSAPDLASAQDGTSNIFGHSSLSPFCNGRCGDIPVNRFCLLETEQDTIRRAQEFCNGGGEPEPYVVVEVWKREEC